MAKRRPRTNADPDTTLPDEAAVETESATQKDLSPEEKKRKKYVEGRLALARAQFRSCVNATDHFRRNAIDDQRFRAGTWGDRSFQWPAGIAEARRAAGRVVLTINRIPEFIRQVTNQARAAHLAVQVSPVDDKGDVKVAEVIGGIIRNIENASFADRAYSKASDKQAEQGLGFFKLVTEWATNKIDNLEGLFRQVIRIKRVKNPLNIFVDPSAQEMDFSDANFGFEVEDLGKEDYEEQTGEKFPNAATIALFQQEGTETGDWFPGGKKIRVAKWINRENDGPEIDVALLSDGSILKNPTDKKIAKIEAAGGTIKKRRMVQPKKMVVRKIDAIRIHEETVWPADALPWIPVIGDEFEIDGEIDYRGVTRDSKDAARVYNVEVSALTEMVAQGPKAPVIGYKGQFGEKNSDQRKAWEQAHVKPVPFLEVNPTDIDGKPAQWIGRQNMELPLEGTVVAIQQADNDLKTLGGFRDASLGERGPQESGKAILARQRQDELGSSHYLDNLRYAIASGGRQMIQLIRTVLDVPTVIRITGTDDRQRKVMVFSGEENDPRRPEFQQIHRGPQPLDHPDGPVQPGQPIPFQLPDGVKEIYNIGVGEFDVVVNAGPQPGTRRQEEVDAITAIFKGMPPEVSVKFLDLYFMLMDFSVAKQMSERAKKMLPPELRDDDEEGGANIPPQVASQMAQMQQALQELMQAYQEVTKKLERDQVKVDSNEKIKNAELAFKNREMLLEHQVAMEEERTKRLVAEAKIDAEKAIAILKADVERLTQQVQHQHEDRMGAEDRAHEADRAGFESAVGEHGKAVDRTHQQQEGAVAHQRARETQERTHQQSRETQERGHRHKVEEIKAKPQPKGTSGKKGKT